MDVSIEIDIDVKKHVGALKNPALWKFAATEWHRLYREYVPFREGILYRQVSITGASLDGAITHTAPYAHYVYEGRVMGPSIPLMQGGVIVGFFSPSAPKVKTVQMLKFSKLYSRKACAHWDQAAIASQKPLLVSAVQAYIDSGRADI